MKLVSRADFGWPVSPAADQPTTQGVKIHYEGAPVNGLHDNHNACLSEWRNIRDSHMANISEGWVDIAYNFGVCPHGYVLEGRGLGKETGANGNQPLNHAHYAVCGLVGSAGETQPTDDMLNGLRDAIEYMRANGAGSDILGHRDGYATDCPGDPLYSWVTSGAQRPNSPAPTPAPSPAPVQPSAPAWPGEYLVLQSPMLHDDNVKTWQQQMSDRGWTITVDGWYGNQSKTVCEQFQQDSTDHGWPLNVDGDVGPATWRASWERPIS